MHRNPQGRARMIVGLAFAIVMTGVVAYGQPPQPQPPRLPKGVTDSIILPQGSVQRLGLSTGKDIRSVEVDKETVVRASPVVADQKVVNLLGISPGVARVTLTDVEGRQEVYEVVVQIDIELIRKLIRQAVPTANVEVIPAQGGVIVLKGHVAHAEDVQVIQRIAGGVAGANNVIDATVVGGVATVQLDVVVAVVNRTEARNLGVNILYGGGNFFGGNQTGLLTSIGALGGGGVGGAGGAGGGGTLGPNTAIGAPAATTNLAFGLVPQNFLTFLQALRQERLAKFLAEPKLVTQSGRPATFLSGGQQAVPEVTASGVGGGTVGTRFEPFGTRLTFLPIVLGNGKIYLEVEPSISNLNAANGFTLTGGFVVQGRDEQTIRTAITLESGQTYAIGGLIQNSVNATANKIPFFGEIPFLGTLMNTIQYSEQETELIILVTPHLVDAMDCNQVPVRVPGRETRSPDDFELFLEGILEAPRGQRCVFDRGKYIPAWKNDPTAPRFPCGMGMCDESAPLPRGGRGCTTGGCSPTGGCGNQGSQGYGMPVAQPIMSPVNQQSLPTYAPDSSTPGVLPATPTVPSPDAGLSVETLPMPLGGTGGRNRGYELPPYRNPGLTR
jgi:pilus assembly protein CpaC